MIDERNKELDNNTDDNNNKDNRGNINNNNDINDGDDGGSMADISDAVLDMLKEKDAKIEQLQKDVTELKKSNANLLVRVSAGEKHQEKTFEENLFGLVGEPTKRR